MKYVFLALAAMLSACTYPEIPTGNVWSSKLDTALPATTRHVQVLGRTWTVYPVEDQTAVYVAQRDNLDLNPFGAPSARRTPQAVRAIELATGCKVVRPSLQQDSSARFFARVNCG